MRTTHRRKQAAEEWASLAILLALAVLTWWAIT
jgi:hypothetical protein